MKNNTKQTLKIYWQHMAKYPWSIFVIACGGITATLADVVVPIYYKRIFNIISTAEPSKMVVQSLLLILCSVAFFNFISWLGWRVASFTNSAFNNRVMANLSNTCFSYLHKHSFAYFNNNFVGSLVKRVNWFVRGFDGLSDRITYTFLPLTTLLISAIVILLYQNIILGLLMLAWLIVFLIVNWFITGYKFKIDIARNEAESKSTGVLADTITNNANVKLFCGHQRECSFYASIVDVVKALRLKSWNLDCTIHSVQGMLGMVLEIGTFYYGIKLWQRGLFTVGDFVLLQSYVLMIIIKIWDFSNVLRHLYQDLADAEEMTIVLQTPHEIQDTKNAKDIVIENGEIEFRNVTFSYNQTREIIEKFNLIVKPKEKLGVVGPSGSGKTTMIKLILRMYELTAGKILIDGQNIAKVKQGSLWASASMVPQDPILFHRTLMENIRYGKPNATDEEVYDAARLAHCHEFIYEFPDGYNTYVGERGMKLSGGERQRVAIARAILRNAPILILDEATSSLDSESERLIQDALDNLMRDKTVIVIAHRLSTIMKMDRIVVIDGGQIVEDGTHAKLLRRRGGLYKKLWNLQAGGFIQ